MVNVTINSFRTSISFSWEEEYFKADYQIITALVDSKLKEMKEKNLEGIKISRHSIKELNNSHTILCDGTILRHFHSKDKEGHEILPKSQGLVINDEVRIKKPKKMFDQQGNLSHVLSVFIRQDIKERVIEKTKTIMNKFSRYPAFLKNYCLEWETREGDKDQCLISRYIGPDLLIFFSKLPDHFDFADLVDVLISMSRLIKAMHDENWAHLDIKPENFLIESKNGSYMIYIIDFDFSEELKDNVSISPRGSPGFVAPELSNSNINGGFQAKKADIYSLGKTFNDLVEMVYHNTKNMESALQLLRLSEKMSRQHPSKRPTIEEVIRELTRLSSVLS